ncbi:MAG: aspartate aminotransferase, partial [Oscillospiraceae bacterium]|nr:aspartate aminotransferase [Oscillospiraceae bacterium]
ADWVNELCGTIRTNVDYACTFIEKNFPGVTVSRPQGTYMLFLDCTQWCQKSGVTLDEVIRRGWDVGVVWQDGRPFHGKCHIRMNLALPLSRVQEAFDRLAKYVFI